MNIFSYSTGRYFGFYFKNKQYESNLGLMSLFDAVFISCIWYSHYKLGVFHGYFKKCCFFYYGVFIADENKD